MVSEGRLLAAIRRLYDAATDAEKWPAFLEELAACFGGNGAHMLRILPREQALNFSVLYGYDDVLRRLYGGDGTTDLGTITARYEQHLAELMPHDPRTQFLVRYPSRPLNCRQELTDAELHSSRKYKDLLDTADVEYSLMVSIPEDDGSLLVFGVFRCKKSSAFSQRDTELFSEIIPHVKQAIAIGEHLARVNFSNNAALEALDAISMGILIVDEHARAMHANAAANRLLGLDDGLSIQNGVLKLGTREEDASLRRAIWDAVAAVGTEQVPANQALAATRSSGNEPFPLLVGALWGNHLRYGLGRLDKPLAVVLVTDPEQPQEAPAELLRRLFGLTPTEARICERLVRGATVEQSARDLNVATGTVRAHLKSVFAKAGVGRQAELVAKVMSSPVWIRNHRRGAPSLGPGGKEVVGS